MEAKKIDYKKVFQEIKLRRKLYAIIIPIVFVLSCLYIVCVPRVYTAEAVVVPEVESAGYHRWFHAVLLSRDHRKSHGTDHGIF